MLEWITALSTDHKQLLMGRSRLQVYADLLTTLRRAPAFLLALTAFVIYGAPYLLLSWCCKLIRPTNLLRAEDGKVLKGFLSAVTIQVHRAENAQVQRYHDTSAVRRIRPSPIL